jgi:hypothetical protein
MIVSMYRLGTAFFLAFMLAAASASAHVDMIAPLAKVEKEYAAPKPLGRLRVTYSGPEAGKEPGLAVECDLFRASVPARGLADLPRPDWECFFAAYSLTSYDSGKLTERRYVYVQVPLSGPAGKAPWEQTWATFHFDADGKLIRRIKRFISSEATKGIRVVWKEWEIGSGVSADALLESANDE